MTMKTIYVTVTPHYELEEGSCLATLEEAKAFIIQEAKDTVPDYCSRYGSQEKYISQSKIQTVEVTEEEWQDFLADSEGAGNLFYVLEEIVKLSGRKLNPKDI